jgi:hypothetical protein
MTIENSDGGDKYIQNRFIVCPNEECQKISLNTTLYSAIYEHGSYTPNQEENYWNLIPRSNANQFNEEYKIPIAILNDYEEACLIESLSPKASATLSRRCLQGMIRDFWSIKKPADHKGLWSLIHEIKAIKEKVDPDVWEAIEAVRKVGNIGAHMELDVNVIIDVSKEEARKLIELIELLLEEWYVYRYLRAKRLAEIKQISDDKAAKKEKTK